MSEYNQDPVDPEEEINPYKSGQIQSDPNEIKSKLIFFVVAILLLAGMKFFLGF